MVQINMLWVAAGVSTGVAIVKGHSDQGQKLQFGLKSLNNGKNRFLSYGGDAVDLLPTSGARNSKVGGLLGGSAEEKSRRSDDYFRQVMYLSCWGQS